ncbi:MAG TPA: ABC transporter ATP-binding protein [Acidimicrobiales bacterium]
MTALLSVQGACKSFGGISALDGCSFDIEEGSVTGLIGPNGSGKTTTFNVITGYERADSGLLSLRGRAIARPDPCRMYRLGLARTFQQSRVLPALTALENVVVARSQPWYRLFRRRASAAETSRALELLAEFNLADYADRPAGVLSYGQRKLLEFAAVLMDDPTLVLLDEPTAGINPVMKEAMEAHVRSRNEKGVTFLIVEHEMQFVMRLCDQIVVLDRGRLIASGRPGTIQEDPRVLDAYLGE